MSLLQCLARFPAALAITQSSKDNETDVSDGNPAPAAISVKPCHSAACETPSELNNETGVSAVLKKLSLSSLRGGANKKSQSRGAIPEPSSEAHVVLGTPGIYSQQVVLLHD
jgi:hypothetical protein